MELILCSGVFSFDNKENKHNVAVNIVKSEGSSFKTRSRRVLHDVFYPYSDMILMPQDYCLKNRKFLFPIARVQRSVRAVYLRRADKTMKYIMQQAFVPKEIVEQRIKILEKWDL